jgi:carbamoyl-phosphate synthase small subunit
MPETSSVGPKRRCILALEDGTVFEGRAFGGAGTQSGEVVFNTAMTGYQEILTDPSYCGQIVTMTYPHIGNYGVNTEDVESARPHVTGFVVREFAGRSSNQRALMALEDYLSENGIIGIAGIDTRALTRKLRVDGAMRGVLTTEVNDGPHADAACWNHWVNLARETPSMLGADLVRQVSPKESFVWTEGLNGQLQALRTYIGQQRRVVAIDCGMKRNILRHLVDIGCEVCVVPPTFSADRILELEPDGIFVSNGPGDPAAVGYAVELLRGLIGKLPIFGICLGHQLLALALGATSFKLKFGHRGANQPVKNLATGRVEITSQNHGFAIETGSLEAAGGTPTHVNLNDETLEGFIQRDLAILALQYHPEAGPGPHDAAYLFDCFATMMATGRAPTAEQMAEAQAALQKRSANRIGIP